ncbi:MAG: hypothetical protein ABI968_07825 [Acidobacteriota bacterium]
MLPVRLIVTGPVAAVEIELDGKTLRTMRTPPWSADVDLGSALAPHELIARALAPDGSRVAISRQWLNLPRPPAEVEVLLEQGVDGRAKAAQLSWQSVTAQEPKTVTAKLNGKPLDVSPERRLTLPAYEAGETQLLSIELEFDNDVKSRKDVVLGGASGSEAGHELTSIPIRVKGSGEPTASTLRGSFASRGGTLSVAGVEEGPAFLWVVRDSSAAEAARHLGELGLKMFTSRFGSSSRYPGENLKLSLEAGDRMRFVWPRPVAVAGSALPVHLFPTSRAFLGDKAGLRWLLTSVHNPAPESTGAHFADAVAVAGINAYACLQRRAVLLVLGGSDVDESQYAAESVRRYLGSLHVPVYVWSLGAPSRSAAAWGSVRDVSTTLGMLEAFAEIRKDLASQRIAWVEGRLLPQDIDIAPGTESVELVR